jgi:hypothetical protein
VEEQPEQQPQRSGSNRRNIVGLIVVVVVAVLCWLLIRELQAESRLEDWQLSGRRDCVPIPGGN